MNALSANINSAFTATVVLSLETKSSFEFLA